MILSCISVNYYAPPLIGRALSDDAVWRLSVAYIRPKSRTERPRKTKIGTKVANVTHDSDTTFKVKGQGHQAALLTVAFTHQAAAVVTVGTYSPWEHMLRCGLQARSARRRETLWRPQREERGGAYCGGRPHNLFNVTFGNFINDL